MMFDLAANFIATTPALLRPLFLPLGMTFLAFPFLAAGTALISIPIIIHILNRRRFRTINWAAMEFLLRAMKKNRRRLKFEQILLLATRCLLLFLFGMALARPSLRRENLLASLAGRRTVVHILVVSNAYSMAYEADRPNAKSHLDQAKILAKGLIAKLSSGSESVVLIAAARPAAAVIAEPAYDLKAATDAVDRLQQTYAAADLSAALALATQTARAQPNGIEVSLDLIDDSTRAAWLDQPEQIQQSCKELADLCKAGVTHYSLGLANQWNVAVVDLRSPPILVTNWFRNDFVADARGFGSIPGEAQIVWQTDERDSDRASATVHVDAQPTDVTHTVGQFAGGGTHVIAAHLIGGDRLPADDIRYRVVDVADDARMLIVEGERSPGSLGGSGVYLDVAFTGGAGGADDPGHKAASYLQIERISDLELGNKVLGDYRCIALCGVGSIQENTAAQLEKFVQQGGTVLVFMGNPVTAENYNATLYKHHLLPGPLTKRMTATGAQQPYTFDFNPHGVLHPILNDFKNQENTGLNTVDVYSYWQVDLAPDTKAERVLDFLPTDANKSQRDPAITVHSLGDGRVVFFATSADNDPDWTTFPAKKSYVELMNSLVLGTVGNGDHWLNLTVGQNLIVPPSIKLTAAPVLKDSSEAEIPLEAGAEGDGQISYRSPALNKPGIYNLWTGQRMLKVAVNLPAEGADVRTLDGAALKKAMGDIDVKLLGDTLLADSAQELRGNDIGWIVMVGVLALVGAECFLAMFFGHHRRRAVVGRT